ncbi:hypothetical protein BXZ70DRAFT_918637 [Cristinia sonorae]|uniref:G-patch domain-containing protein n=1 Tax=Cristinia sonorae TaxID=1940300 RepID=A0A8K0XUH8_9AGAR|nr:hypothetical protein BXZ70DRAFT_918637 [Cristinia sonorae]
MSDDEDDYLSDKFLFTEASTSTAPKTYSQRRKEKERLAALKNEQNRKKSRRELEQESREAGLSKSLFERAQEEASGIGKQNKALQMMLKMGFKPGQSLGQTAPDDPPDETAPEASRAETPGLDDPTTGSRKHSKGVARHLVAPLPLNEWSGRTGIGVRKRAPSPIASERIAKMAKMAEAHDHTSFRDRARQDYEDRRAEGRLGPAQRTCATLDEKAGRKFNVLSLDPQDPDTFPEGLIDMLEDDVLSNRLDQMRKHNAIEGRLRARMHADALRPLQPLSHDDDDDDEADSVQLTGLKPPKADLHDAPYSEEDLEECTAFLRLSAKDRLSLVLDYLRDRYMYCFWCGTQYDNLEDIDTNCPGREEEDHD